MDPALRKFSILYSERISIKHVYGGLLQNWNGFSDAGNGIRHPADVALHWEEVAKHSGQPINPRVWLDDPLDSSWPACLACLAVRSLEPSRELPYLRLLREAVFLDARNIAREDILAELAERVGIDRMRFMARLKGEETALSFQRDRELMHSSGMRGFPSMLFIRGQQTRGIQGARNFGVIEATYLAMSGDSVQRLPGGQEAWIKALGHGTSIEFAEAFGCNIDEAESLLTAEGMVFREVGGSKYWVAR
jgi:protein-disulfide isomerase-like protein with CxxC motif